MANRFTNLFFFFFFKSCFS